MSMSRKDFQELADAIKFALVRLKGPEKAVAIHLIKAVADGCRRCNSGFDYNRFYTACGLTEGDLK